MDRKNTGLNDRRIVSTRLKLHTYTLTTIKLTEKPRCNVGEKRKHPKGNCLVEEYQHSTHGHQQREEHLQSITSNCGCRRDVFWPEKKGKKKCRVRIDYLSAVTT